MFVTRKQREGFQLRYCVVERFLLKAFFVILR